MIHLENHLRNTSKWDYTQAQLLNVSKRVSFAPRPLVSENCYPRSRKRDRDSKGPPPIPPLQKIPFPSRIISSGEPVCSKSSPPRRKRLYSTIIPPFIYGDICTQIRIQNVGIIYNEICYPVVLMAHQIHVDQICVDKRCSHERIHQCAEGNKHQKEGKIYACCCFEEQNCPFRERTCPR